MGRQGRDGLATGGADVVGLWGDKAGTALLRGLRMWFACGETRPGRPCYEGVPECGSLVGRQGRDGLATGAADVVSL